MIWNYIELSDVLCLLGAVAVFVAGYIWGKERERQSRWKHFSDGYAAGQREKKASTQSPA